MASKENVDIARKKYEKNVVYAMWDCTWIVFKIITQNKVLWTIEFNKICLKLFDI